MRILLLGIRIRIMFLLTAFAQLLLLLSAIRTLGNRPLRHFFVSLLEPILNNFKNNLGPFLVFWVRFDIFFLKL